MGCRGRQDRVLEVERKGGETSEGVKGGRVERLRFEEDGGGMDDCT